MKVCPDLSREHDDYMCPVGSWDTTTDGPDFVVLDGVLYAWSESNLQYEEVWWLDPNLKETDLVKALRKERPGPIGWEDYKPQWYLEDAKAFKEMNNG